MAQTDFMEVGVCCEAAETMGGLPRWEVSWEGCQGFSGEGRCGIYEQEGVEFGDVETEEDVKENLVR